MRRRFLAALALVSLIAVGDLTAQTRTGDDVSTLLRPLEAALATLRAALTTPPVSARPRLDATQLVWERSFRLPSGAANGQTFEFGGGPFALDATAHTLFVGSRSGQLAELTIPAAGDGAATFVQGFAEPSEGSIRATFGDQAALAGLLVLDDGRLLADVLWYYDANNAQRVSHFLRPRDLGDRGHVSPLVSVGDPAMTGYVAGYLARVPLEWRPALHGPAITGTFGNPIVSRESLGPAAFAFTPAGAAMPGTPLVYYPSAHPTLGAYVTGPPNPVFNNAAKADGLVLIDGTSTALFLGRSGLGEQLYGAGTGTLTQVGTIESGSDRYVFDPTNSSKGTHAYPYRYQIWAYDLNDFAAVAAGTKQPWDVVPYAVWPLDLPTPDPAFTGLGGAAYDAAAHRLYISQLRADVDGYAYRAIVHVFRIGLP